MTERTNCQCAQCGLCTDTSDEMMKHWDATGHSAYRVVTVSSLVAHITYNLKGLETFKRSIK